MKKIRQQLKTFCDDGDVDDDVGNKLTTSRPTTIDPFVEFLSEDQRQCRKPTVNDLSDSILGLDNLDNDHYSYANSQKLVDDVGTTCKEHLMMAFRDNVILRSVRCNDCDYVQGDVDELVTRTICWHSAGRDWQQL